MVSKRIRINVNILSRCRYNVTSDLVVVVITMTNVFFISDIYETYMNADGLLYNLISFLKCKCTFQVEGFF